MAPAEGVEGYSEPGIGAEFGRVESPSGPCRTIAITPQVRLLDELQRKARQPVLTWKRPAPAREVEPSGLLGLQYKQRNHSSASEKRRAQIDMMVWRNCEWCDARLTSREMAGHRKVCAKRPAKPETGSAVR